MDESRTDYSVEARQGATVKIEHKRGTGTRDQDKVEVKIHEPEKVTPEGLANACTEAVQKTVETMEELRDSIYTGDEAGDIQQ